jgi:hypothetical protein
MLLTFKFPLIITLLLISIFVRFVNRDNFGIYVKGLLQIYNVSIVECKLYKYSSIVIADKTCTQLPNFNPEIEDMLLAVSAKTNGIAFAGAGDYELTDRRLDYRPNGVSASYVFIGHRVVMPAFMQMCAEKLQPTKGGCFSFKDCFDIAESNSRLMVCRFDGTWCDLSTVDTLNALRDVLQ